MDFLNRKTKQLPTYEDTKDYYDTTAQVEKLMDMTKLKPAVTKPPAVQQHPKKQVKEHSFQGSFMGVLNSILTRLDRLEKLFIDYIDERTK